MSEIGLEVGSESIVEGDHSMEGGMRALGKLMRLRLRPTGVLCSNDMTAIGVMREAYDLGNVVPRDLSVVGFDNIRSSEFTIPQLTTVEMSQSELARIAFRALLEDVAQKGGSERRKDYPLSTNLVIRRCTALAPADPVRVSLSRKS